MVKLQASILLLVLAFNIGAPVLPWLEYAANYKYIVENLCVQRNQKENSCNGMCHLKKNIEKQEPSHNNTNKHQIPGVRTFQLEPVIVVSAEPLQMITIECNRNPVPYFLKYNFQFISEEFHPPKYCLSAKYIC